MDCSALGRKVKKTPVQNWTVSALLVIKFFLFPLNSKNTFFKKVKNGDGCRTYILIIVFSAKNVVIEFWAMNQIFLPSISD